MPLRVVEGFAPAKVNLALHVTGRRADGYHLLDSFVVFAAVGDRLRAEPAEHLTLEVTGPRAAGVPMDGTNLVLRAAAALGADRGARIVLDKHLPAAAGIGGGSSDAATALRVLAALWELPLPGDDAVLALGADVPVCLAGHAARMRGIGERLDRLPDLPPAWLVLVNPGVSVPTGPVFDGLASRDNPPMPELRPWPDATALAEWLREARNDLEPPARMVAPAIGDVIDRLAATDGCLLSRMSGSGATCFGLFASPTGASAAARAMRRARPDWWIADAAVMRDQATRATT